MRVSIEHKRLLLLVVAGVLICAGLTLAWAQATRPSFSLNSPASFPVDI